MGSVAASVAVPVAPIDARQLLTVSDFPSDQLLSMQRFLRVAAAK
jgi:hypothetical protein